MRTQTVAPADELRTAKAAAPYRLGLVGDGDRRILVGGRGLRALGLLVGLAALLAVAVASVAYGSKPIAIGEVFTGIVDFDGSNDHLVIRSLRLPRTVVGLAVGAALGLAGAVMQALTRNPLADPGILGVNAGASLFVVIAIYLFGVGSLSGYVWFAFAGAAAVSLVVYGLGALGRDGATPVKLTVAGAAVAAFLASVTTAILIVDVATLDQYRFWVVGSLAGRDAGIAVQVAPFLAAGALLALGSARSLNSLSLGDDVARSLGLRIGAVRVVSAVSVVLLCGGAAAAAGPIGFVGLTVPHVARAICGPDYRWILPYSAVLAPILLIGSDIVGRLVVRPAELQVGIITALVGAPFFVVLVRRRRLARL